MDISALITRKSAAKCDTSCELQGSANHEVLERTLRPWDPSQGHTCLSVVNNNNNPK